MTTDDYVLDEMLGRWCIYKVDRPYEDRRYDRRLPYSKVEGLPSFRLKREAKAHLDKLREEGVLPPKPKRLVRKCPSCRRRTALVDDGGGIPICFSCIYDAKHLFCTNTPNCDDFGCGPSRK